MAATVGFLEGQARYEKIFSKYPPARVHVFSKRLTIWRGDEDQAWYGTTGKTAYAWFVWDRDYTGPTTVVAMTDNPYKLPDGNVQIRFLAVAEQARLCCMKYVQANGDLPERCQVMFANTGDASNTGVQL